MTNYIIKGLKRVYDEEKDVFVYFNDQMIEDNVLIEELTIFPEENKVETIISVQHINDVDASDFTLYWGTLLEPIQVYRILKDITDLYSDNSLKDFLEIIKELSPQYSSSSIQSDENHRVSIRERIKGSFTFIQSL